MLRITSRIMAPNSAQKYTKFATKFFEHGFDPPPGLNNVQKYRRFGTGGRPLVGHSAVGPTWLKSTAPKMVFILGNRFLFQMLGG